MREEDVTPYLSFIDDLHQALQIAAQNAHHGKGIGNSKPFISDYIRSQLDNRIGLKKQDSADAMLKALWNAKQGLVPLSEFKFAQIMRELLTEADDMLWREKLTKDFQNYNRAAHTMGAQQNPFHGPFSISAKNSDIGFQLLLSTANVELSHLISDPKHFYEFVYESVERLACADQFGRATRNAMVICDYMWNHRSEAPLSRLNELDFAALRATAARLGAWASMTSGQLGTFRYFRRILRKCSQSRTKSTMLFDAVMSAHNSAMMANLSNNPLTHSSFLISYDMAKELEDDFVTETSDDLSIIYANIVTHYIANGLGMGDQIPQLGMTIREALERGERHESSPAYELISRFKHHGIKARAHLNDNNVTDAERHQCEMALIKNRPDFTFRKIGEAIYCTTAGQIEKHKTRSKGSNAYLDQGKSVFLEIGDLIGYGRVLRIIDR